MADMEQIEPAVGKGDLQATRAVLRNAIDQLGAADNVTHG
jgi:hypothetical protein